MQKFDLFPPVISGFQQIMKAASERLIKIITRPLLTVALLVSVTAENVFAQVPSISYGVAKNYLVNAAITPLSPTNNGGAVTAPGYSSSPVNIFSGTSYSVSFVRDASNNIYTFDFSVSNNRKLVKLSPTGTNPVELLTFLGRPEDIAIDPSGNVFALDGATIYKITPAGAVSTFQTVSSASGIGIDGAGNVYVARYSASTTSILEFPADGGSSISIGSGLGYMTDVAVDAAGNVYVCNDNDASIKKIPADGSSMITIASGFTNFSTADLSQITVDPSGNIFFSESNASKVSEIPAGSNTPIAIGSGFFAPEGLMLDATGNLFIIDNGTLKKFKPIGGYYISPALPAGLSIDQTTGIISGTPTVLSDATNYTITASNASGSSSVTISIGVLASVSTDANLTGLTISPGSFSPAFDKARFLYTMDVPYSTTSITLTPTLEDPNATVQIYAHFVTSGTPSLDIPLAPGTNTASVLVFAQDGTTKNVYRVAVTRAAASTVADLSNLTTSANSFTPAFDVNTTSYNASVPNDSLTTTITPTVADASATIKVRVNAGSYKLISSGSMSDLLALHAGDNKIDVQVTAQDGTTTKTYTLTVNRALATNNVLTTLKYYPGIMQTQVGGPDYKNFTATVANTFTSITA
uniref:cadherin-like beta sandwich domain-containing protein n=1 Tax=Mucilaginibacter sp. TaxID=1882438 RepID=UPI00374DF18E